MDITYQLEEKERRIEELQKEVDDVLLKNKELETALEEEKKKVAALADELETMSAHVEKHTVKESSETVDEEALAAVRAGEDGSGV